MERKGDRVIVVPGCRQAECTNIPINVSEDEAIESAKNLILTHKDSIVIIIDANLYTEEIEAILEFVGDDKGSNIVDLGSGDGSILVELAKNGFSPTGYEINKLLYFVSLIKIYFQKQSSNIIVLRKNFWEEDLSKHDVIIINRA